MVFLTTCCLQWFQTMPDHWKGFVYQYGVGGAFFLFIMIVALHGKTVRLSTHTGKVMFCVVTGGFLFAMITHALWIYMLTK